MNESSVTYYSVHAYDGLAALDAVAFNNQFAPHFHDTFQLTWNRTGIFENQINNRSLKFWPDSIALSHPGEVHQTICQQPQGNSFFTVYLPPTLFDQDVETGHMSLAHSIIDQDLLWLLMNLRKVMLAAQIPQHGLIEQLVQILQIRHGCRHTKPTEHSLLVDYAQNYFLEPFDLSKWSNHMGMDKYKVIRLFKSETGMTPNQYVIHSRVQHSLTALKAGQSIIEAALGSGFFDTAHYYKNFKKIMGMTPKKYQQAFIQSY
ncbi:MAG: AraC family transcriptional regulator [Marinicella sp.]